MKLYTDYPIRGLDDSDIDAPIREIKILHYDHNKYVTILVCGVENITDSIKLGYIYKEPKRLGETPGLTHEEVEQILADKYKYKNKDQIFVSVPDEQWPRAGCKYIFRYNKAAECYYCDFGKHQIHIQTEDNGAHWTANISWNTNPFEAHEPETCALDLITAIKELADSL